MGGKTPEEKRGCANGCSGNTTGWRPHLPPARAIARLPKADDNVYQLYTGLANDALKVLDGALAKSSFLVGNDATVADVAVYGDVAYAEEGAIDLSPYANVKAWMARVEKLPGFKKYVAVLPKQDAA
jgi:glutathione S-transferase